MRGRPLSLRLSLPKIENGEEAVGSVMTDLWVFVR